MYSGGRGEVVSACPAPRSVGLRGQQAVGAGDLRLGPSGAWAPASFGTAIDLLPMDLSRLVAPIAKHGARVARFGGNRDFFALIPSHLVESAVVSFFRRPSLSVSDEEGGSCRPASWAALSIEAHFFAATAGQSRRPSTAARSADQKFIGTKKQYTEDWPPPTLSR